MNFEKLAKEAYENAKLHGWHDEEHSDYHWLFMVITELAEVAEADRCGRHANLNAFKKTCQNDKDKHILFDSVGQEKWNQAFQLYIKNSMEDELADVCIRLFDLAGLRGVNFTYLKDSYDAPDLKFKDNVIITDFLFGVARALTNIEEEEECDLELIINLTLYCITQFCKYKNVDLEWFIEAKMRYNKSRSFRHGGKNY